MPELESAEPLPLPGRHHRLGPRLAAPKHGPAPEESPAPPVQRRAQQVATET